MKFVEPSGFAFPTPPPARLAEIANGIEAVHDSRIYIELVMAIVAAWKAGGPAAGLSWLTSPSKRLEPKAEPYLNPKLYRRRS